MFTIRGKLVIYALEIVAAAVLLLSIPPSKDVWIWVGLAGLAVLAIGLAAAMGWSISVAVSELGAATPQIGGDNYEIPVRVRGEDEIGRLGSDLESMGIQLREKVRLLEEFGRELEQKMTERTAQLQKANGRLALIHEVTNAVNPPVQRAAAPRHLDQRLQ